MPVACHLTCILHSLLFLSGCVSGVQSPDFKNILGCFESSDGLGTCFELLAIIFSVCIFVPPTLFSITHIIFLVTSPLIVRNANFSNADSKSKMHDMQWITLLHGPVSVSIVSSKAIDSCIYLMPMGKRLRAYCS